MLYLVWTGLTEQMTRHSGTIEKKHFRSIQNLILIVDLAKCSLTPNNGTLHYMFYIIHFNEKTS